MLYTREQHEALRSVCGRFGRVTDTSMLTNETCSLVLDPDELRILHQLSGLISMNAVVGNYAIQASDKEIEALERFVDNVLSIKNASDINSKELGTIISEQDINTLRAIGGRIAQSGRR